MRVSTVIHARLPILRPFRTAAGVVTSRDAVFVKVESATDHGWGEAVSWPGDLDESPEDIWESIVAGSPGIAGRAAIDEARADLAARLAGVSLASHIGGREGPLANSLAVGLGEDAGVAAADAAAAGYTTIKLKVEPGNDVARVRRAIEAAPGLFVGVDGNGSYAPLDVTAIMAIEAAGAAYVEQPYPRGSHAGHRELGLRLSVPLILDEDVRSVDDARAVIEAGAADVLAVKPGALGIAGALAVHAMATSAGLKIKPSGFLESGIGRAHTAAIASLPEVVWADLAPATAYFTIDPVRPVRGGGIGVDVDDDALVSVMVRREDL